MVDIADLQINGWAADKYGPKIVMMVSTVALAGFIFLSVFGEYLFLYLGTRLICSPESRYFGGCSSTLRSREFQRAIMESCR